MVVKKDTKQAWPHVLLCPCPHLTLGLMLTSALLASYCQGPTEEGTHSRDMSPLSRKDHDRPWDPWIKEQVSVSVACSECGSASGCRWNHTPGEGQSPVVGSTCPKAGKGPGSSGLLPRPRWWLWADSEHCKDESTWKKWARRNTLPSGK